MGPEGAADVVVDLHDPGWPVIRRMSPALADRLGAEVFLAETRAFSPRRAATWEARFPDDDPAYAAVVAEAGLHAGQTALDAGCGTGRALPHLRAAVGPDGRVLGFDLTPEMLAPGPLGHQLRSTGWRPARYDDGPDRFLTVAERTSPTVSGRRPGRS